MHLLLTVNCKSKPCLFTWNYKAPILTLVALNFLFHAINTNVDHVSSANYKVQHNNILFFTYPSLAGPFLPFSGAYAKCFLGPLFWETVPGDSKDGKYPLIWLGGMHLTF